MFYFFFIFVLKEAYAIAGGQDADLKNHTYIVSLRTVGHFCAGSILDERHILTACHCINKFPKHKIKVVAGTHLRRSISRNGQQFEVQDMKCHDDYEYFPKRHDIAIIRVNRNIKFNRFTDRIKLPTQDVRGLTETVAAGWGQFLQPGAYPLVLQKLEQMVLRFDKCKNYYSITDAHLCTISSKGQGLCCGDSGGPVVSLDDNTLIGVISMGRTVCGSGKPDINTKVFSYLGWIEKEIKILTNDVNTNIL